MASHGGVRTKIALLGRYRGPHRPPAGRWYVFVRYASLRSKVKNLSTVCDAEHSQLHSPERPSRELGQCNGKGYAVFMKESCMNWLKQRLQDERACNSEQLSLLDSCPAM